MPLLPVLEFWRGYFGITEHDTARAARDKIAGRMLLLDERLGEGLAVMFDEHARRRRARDVDAGHAGAR